MAKLTTHVLDTASGKPAAGLHVVLRRADAPAVLAEATTNADGRLEIFARGTDNALWQRP